MSSLTDFYKHKYGDHTPIKGENYHKCYEETKKLALNSKLLSGQKTKMRTKVVEDKVTAEKWK